MATRLLSCASVKEWKKVNVSGGAKGSSGRYNYCPKIRRINRKVAALFFVIVFNGLGEILENSHLTDFGVSPGGEADFKEPGCAARRNRQLAS